MLNAGEDVKQQEPWLSASRNTNWYNYLENCLKISIKAENTNVYDQAIPFPDEHPIET